MKPLSALINQLANLDTGRWRTISHTMSWAFRDTPGRPPVPPIIDRFFGVSEITEHDWVIIRGQVNRVRQRERMVERRERKRREAAQKREYMRRYMQAYRAKRKET
jgi:hypothetical protein